MIKGARIEAIYTVTGSKNGICRFEGYFLCDRGFCFCLPIGGYSWETTLVPPDAARLLDRRSMFDKLVSCLSLRHREPEIVESLTRSQISHVLCNPMLPELDFYDPEGTALVFEDGGVLSVRYAAPEGIGAGLLYYPDRAIETAGMIDYFSTTK